jgi:hypothetical protein
MGNLPKREGHLLQSETLTNFLAAGGKSRWEADACGSAMARAPAKSLRAEGRGFP